eukprot:83015_1
MCMATSGVTKRQIEIFNRLSGFVDEIDNAINSSVNSTKYGKLYICPVIMNEIFLYSNHKQISELWISIYHKLKQFSFMMKQPCSVEEITKFEHKCQVILNDSNYQLPDIFRISLLLCNSVQFPPIFLLNTSEKYTKMTLEYPETYYELFDEFDNKIFESFIKPLNEWTNDKSTITPYEMDDELSDHFDEETVQLLKLWFSEDAVEYEHTFCIANYNTELVAVSVFLNIKTSQIFIFKYGDLELQDIEMALWTMEQFYENINVHCASDDTLFTSKDIYLSLTDDEEIVDWKDEISFVYDGPASDLQDFVDVCEMTLTQKLEAKESQKKRKLSEDHELNKDQPSKKQKTDNF